MSIKSIKISNFRNIASLAVLPHKSFNIIYGNNGSGKTSFLEAVYYLSMGRSFRSRNNQNIIKNNTEGLSVFVESDYNNKVIPIGLSKSISGQRQIRLDSTPCSSIAEITRRIPVKLITTSSHRYFHDGSKQRRQFLDWGLFHVKPNFLALWKNYSRVLKQRNAAIKSRLAQKQIIAWDEELCHYGELLNTERADYVRLLQNQNQQIIKRLLIAAPKLSLLYSKGWDHNKSLENAVKLSLPNDLYTGYTTCGPHRADAQLYYESTPAHEYLSNGQQKLAIYSLSLAQGVLVKQSCNKPPIYLIDDLAAELDHDKQEALCQILNELQSQVFITTVIDTKIPIISNADKRTFHMDQGQLSLKQETLGITV